MKEIDAKATTCPYCQSKIYVWTTGRKLTLVLILLVTVTISMATSSNPTPPISAAEQIVNMKKGSAESFARSYVKSILKAPTTAKFSYSASVQEDPKDPNLIEVISSVTSENSYGAHLTNSWSLKMKYVGPDTQEGIDDGTNWRVDEFYFDGKKVE